MWRQCSLRNDFGVDLISLPVMLHFTYLLKNRQLVAWHAGYSQENRWGEFFQICRKIASFFSFIWIWNVFKRQNRPKHEHLSARKHTLFLSLKQHNCERCPLHSPCVHHLRGIPVEGGGWGPLRYPNHRQIQLTPPENKTSSSICLDGFSVHCFP